MNKLLNANFFELFKSKFFYITMAVCAFLGTVLTILMYIYPNVDMPDDTIYYDKANILSLTPSFAALVLPFAASSTEGTQAVSRLEI